MSIVKEILDLHRGELTIDSIWGQGSRVSLTLPMLLPVPALASRPRPADTTQRPEIAAILPAKDLKPGFP